jgi:putative transcriptional regulator
MAMNEEDFEAVLAGLRDVKRFEQGDREGFVVHAPEAVDVRSIRAATKQTQEGFARTYGFSVASVRDWEQGRRRPERAARLLLALIGSEPETVRRALARI